MKKWFINKFPDLLATLLIGFACYEMGHSASRKEISKIRIHCSKRDILNNGNIGAFYKHKGPSNVNSYYAHTEAYTEMNWAKCVKKGIR